MSFRLVTLLVTLWTFTDVVCMLIYVCHVEGALIRVIHVAHTLTV